MRSGGSTLARAFPTAAAIACVAVAGCGGAAAPTPSPRVTTTSTTPAGLAAADAVCRDDVDTVQSELDAYRSNTADRRSGARGPVPTPGDYDPLKLDSVPHHCRGGGPPTWDEAGHVWGELPGGGTYYSPGLTGSRPPSPSAAGP